MRPPRAMEISSFTLIKGSLIPETYAAFQDWELKDTDDFNFQRLKYKNTVQAPTAHWLRDVLKVLHRRFAPTGRDRALVLLAQSHCPLDIWNPILLWHMTRDEFLLRDFIIRWLFAEFKSGRYTIRTNDVIEYFSTLNTRHAQLISAWSESTRSRLAGSLLKILTDFGLLQGTTARKFAAYHLPDKSFLYLLHALAETEPNARRIIECEDWRLFLMTPDDVEQSLFRLHQFQQVHYEVAGSLAQLKLPYATALEFARRIAA